MELTEYLNQHYSYTAIRGYENLITRFTETLGEKAIKATYADILDYISLLRNQQLHPKTIRNHLFTIKIYYRYLMATGKRQDHPCQYMNLKDPINKHIQTDNLYTKESLEELYENHQSKAQKQQQRDKIIIGLLIYQALTVREITHLEMENINLEEGTIKIAASSKNKGRTLSLKARQILLIHNYITAENRESRYLFPNETGGQLWTGSLNRIINQSRSKEERLLALRIRQSVIFHLLEAGHDLRIVQEFTGHRRTSSTEAYQQNGIKELREAIEKLHPLG